MSVSNCFDRRPLYWLSASVLTAFKCLNRPWFVLYWPLFLVNFGSMDWVIHCYKRLYPLNDICQVFVTFFKFILNEAGTFIMSGNFHWIMGALQFCPLLAVPGQESSPGYQEIYPINIGLLLSSSWGKTHLFCITLEQSSCTGEKLGKKEGR